MSAQGPGEHPEVGSLAEEATALLGALSGWVRENAGDAAAGAGGFAAAAMNSDRSSQEQEDRGDQSTDCACRVCPVCRVIRVARQVSPEVRQNLLDAGGSLVAAVAGLLETHVPAPDASAGETTDSAARTGRPDADHPAGQTEARSPAAHASRARRVSHIRLDDEESRAQ